MEKQSRKSFSFLENINPERKKFIKPFIFGYHGNISLLKRFEERYGQKFFILSTASLASAKGRGLILEGSSPM